MLKIDVWELWWSKEVGLDSLKVFRTWRDGLVGWGQYDRGSVVFRNSWTESLGGWWWSQKMPMS